MRHASPPININCSTLATAGGWNASARSRSTGPVRRPRGWRGPTRRPGRWPTPASTAAEGQEGRWTCRRPLPEQWTIAHGPLVLELKRTVFGHLGVFPEHAANWQWIARAASSPRRKLRVLNLFAYTGGSTLAAAAAGAEVVHVDAAQNILAWARRNAARSGLADAPVRWIAEDAVKFVKRELRRGSPLRGGDPRSAQLRPRRPRRSLAAGKHLPRLLELCGQLTAGQRRFMLLTCHTPDFEPARLAAHDGRRLGPRRTAAAARSTPSR